MPKIGELWINKNDGRIVKIVNISRGGKFGSRTFLHIMAYNPFRRTTVGGTDIDVWDSSWDQNWEKYEHDDSSGGGGSSSVSTPKKKSLALFPDGPLDGWRKKAASEKAPNTVKRPPERIPPLPLTSNPQDKDGGVMPRTSGGSNEQRRLFQENSRAYRSRPRAVRSGPRREQRRQSPYFSSDEDSDDLLDEGPRMTDAEAANNNLTFPNGRWTLTRDFNGNSGSRKIEINQEVVVIGQRSSAQTGGPALVICKYKSFQTGQLRLVRGAIRKDFFIDGTFIFRAWGLNIGGDPPNPPSYEEAERQRVLREGFGFFKNNINIKF